MSRGVQIATLNFQKSDMFRKITGYLVPVVLSHFGSVARQEGYQISRSCECGVTGARRLFEAPIRGNV